MNQTRIEETGLKSMIEIHNSLGGWPVVVGDQWNQNSTWNWQDSSNELLKAGFGHAYLFVISIDIDMRNSSRRRIVVNKNSIFRYLLQKYNLNKKKITNSLMNQHWDCLVSSYYKVQMRVLCKRTTIIW